MFVSISYDIPWSLNFKEWCYLSRKHTSRMYSEENRAVGC